MYNPQLDAFIQVADAGSFSKAAEKLYISSPAVIQQINLLEASCGFKLFIRSNHGVKLTPAGRSLYEDAKTIMQLSQNALSKARRLAEASENTVRVGTSLLYKCRLLPTLWAKISETHPEFKLEILPMSAYRTRQTVFAALGRSFDLFEGIYGTGAWDGMCQFLELAREPIYCAVAPNHPLAGRKRLTVQELADESLVLPIPGASRELDAFRGELLERFPSMRIVDSPYYDMDTFMLCKVNGYVLITQPVYEDIHSDLVTIPLETDYALPYGLIYANEPNDTTRRFLQCVREVM